MKSNKNKWILIISILIAIMIVFFSSLLRGRTIDKNEDISFKENLDTINMEWGDEINIEDLFTINEDIKEYRVFYNYDEHKVGEMQKLTLIITVDKKEYRKEYNIYIEDTKPPVIEYNGDLKIEQFSEFDLNKYLNVYDMMGEFKMYMPKVTGFSNDKRGYTVSVNSGKSVSSVLDTKTPGIYEITIGAYDGHGLYATKTITIEIESQ